MKTLKKFAAMIGLFALLLLSACGGSSAYTVTVECSDSLILGGVQVQLSGEGGSVQVADLKDGKASFDVADGTYEASIICKEGFEGMLDDYVCEIKTLTEKERSVTLHITPIEDTLGGQEKVSYTLTVQTPDGEPAGGIYVQLCGGPDNTCSGKTTNSAGVAEFSLKAGSYEVHIAQSYWPSGYTFDDTKYKVTEAGGALTVTFDAA